MPVIQRRAQDTRSALLHAARQVFADVGYSDASVAEVVSRAGSSVGSMYHHFGGKADLYTALYDGFQTRQDARADGAVREAMAEGEWDPVRLMAAGSRAFLQGAWAERDLARLFLTGDGPPGFDQVLRDGFTGWAQRSGASLRTADGRPLNQAHLLVIGSVIAAGAREVTNQPDSLAAASFTEDVVAMLDRLCRPGAERERDLAEQPG